MTTEGNGDRNEYRKLPSIEALLQTPALVTLAQGRQRALLVTAARATLDDARQAIAAGGHAPAPGDLAARVLRQWEALQRPTLQPVINATGVILHTNLGRAPLSDATRQAMSEAGAGYSNLEFDLDSGQRGSRYIHAEALLCRLTGAEAALVVNNNAAALLLTLSALAVGREVIISRGQLVEIGGGVRIPDVMRQSGARLVEVGTTNRTYLHDYAAAVRPETALLLHVHASNFRQVGFVAQASLAELAELGAQHGIPLVHDLGSGSLLDTQPYGLAGEPTVPESVAAGAALTLFSGDKLLGGPQAGYIVGRKALVTTLRQHPLTRALRVDKVTLAGIQATLLHYLRDEAARELPAWRMLATPPATLAERAARWQAALAAAGLAADIVAGESTIGGGSLPGETLPTHLLALTLPTPTEAAARLRRATPPVIARIADDRLLLDPRTVLPEQDDALIAALRTLRQR